MENERKSERDFFSHTSAIETLSTLNSAPSIINIALANENVSTSVSSSSSSSLVTIAPHATTFANIPFVPTSSITEIKERKIAVSSFSYQQFES